MKPEIQKLIMKYNIKYLSDLPFLISVLPKLGYEINNNQPTLYTDGKIVGINEEFFMKYSNYTGILLHEYLHIVFKHPSVTVQYKNLHNLCTDAVINERIKSLNYTLPDTLIFKEKIFELVEKNRKTWDQKRWNLYWTLKNDFGKLSSDEVYYIALKLTDPQSADVEAREIMAGNELGDHDKTEGETDSVGFDIAGNIIGRETQFKELQPKINWRRYLLSVLSSGISKQRYEYSYTWLRKNRKLPVYPKKIYFNREIETVLVVDYSGSIYDEIFSQFLSEIIKILKDVRVTVLHLYVFTDRTVYSNSFRTFTPEYIKNLLIELREHTGGTDITDTLETIDEKFKDSRNRYLIVFTDGYLLNNADMDSLMRKFKIIYTYTIQLHNSFNRPGIIKIKLV